MKTVKYIIYGFIFLFLAGTIGVRLYITKISPAGPPIPGEPKYKHIEKVKQTSKIEEYEKEIEEKRKEQFSEKIPDAEEIVKVKFNEVINHTVSTDDNKNRIIIKKDHENQESQKNESLQKSQIKQRKYPLKVDNRSSTAIKQEKEPVEKGSQPTKTEPYDPFGTSSAAGYTADIKNEKNQPTGNLFLSEIYGSQKIEDNASVILRLKDPIHTSGTSIPANSKLYGVASCGSNRFSIKINYAKTPVGELPVNMAVYDNDRIEGLYYSPETEKNIDQGSRDIAEDYIDTKSSLLDDIARTVNRGVLREKRAYIRKPDGYRVFVKVL